MRNIAAHSQIIPISVWNTFSPHLHRWPNEAGGRQTHNSRRQCRPRRLELRWPFLGPCCHKQLPSASLKKLKIQCFGLKTVSCTVNFHVSASPSRLGMTGAKKAVCATEQRNAMQGWDGFAISNGFRLSA